MIVPLKGSRRHASGGAALRLAALAVIVCVVGRGAAWGMAADGALVTNTVSATYAGNGGYNGSGCNWCPVFAMSYLASASVLVSCPVVGLQKTGSPTLQATGATVTFTLWVTNASLSASAFNVVLTDKIPDNTVFDAGTQVWQPSGTWYPAYASDNVTFTAGAPANGQGAPYYLRWTANLLGPGRSALVTYFVTVL